MYNTIGGLVCIACTPLVKYLPVDNGLQILFVIGLGISAAVLITKARVNGRSD